MRPRLASTRPNRYPKPMAIFDLLELPAATPRFAPVVGLDLGEKTIGVAVSDASWMIASPLELIRKTKAAPYIPLTLHTLFIPLMLDLLLSQQTTS